MDVFGCLIATDPFASAIVEEEYDSSGQKTSGMQTVHVDSSRSNRNSDMRADINTWGDDVGGGGGGGGGRRRNESKRGEAAGSKTAGGKDSSGSSKSGGGGGESSDSDGSEDDLLGLLDEADDYAANHK